MPVVNIEPSSEHPTPYDTHPEGVATFLEELAVAGNTVELQKALGAQIDIAAEDAEKTAKLLKNAIESKKPELLKTPAVATAASAFLREYGQQLALDVAQTRAAITYKLMEIANCGDPKYELKALELLGKHSDIGIFTERSEITINYRNPDELENAIKERVKRLLNADVIDVTPLGMNLDEELGVASVVDGKLVHTLPGTEEIVVEEETPDETPDET